MIRVLIAEDSVTQREILRKVLEADGEFTVVAEARNGNEAFEMTRQHKPDVVLMDIHMPEMDGIEATRQIMAQCPAPIVVISATLKQHEVDQGIKALEAGAVSVMQKPRGAALLHLKKIAPDLRREIVAASMAKMRRLPAAPRPSDRADAGGIPVTSVDAVGICASTGGPPVLVEILSTLPQAFPLPVLIVQHISSGFEEGFTKWLSAQTGQTVQLAHDGQRLGAGIWFGPVGKHLTVSSRTRIKLLAKEDRDIHCPSGNPLFASLAQHFGARAVGVQLTGMGDDGAQGLLELKRAGGQALIQDEASSMIYGMPKAAKQLGAGTQELNPREIAIVLTKMVGRF